LQIIVTEAGPSAFANIHENYYYVFVVCSAFFLVIAYFFFPYVLSNPHFSSYKHHLTHSCSETKQKTLEEVAASFGDRVVLADEAPKRVSVTGKADHVESADPSASASASA
jgi:hypothetical protein